VRMQVLHSGDCQRMARVLNRIGGKWSVLVIMLLGERPLRFNEMRRIINGISQRMLTLTLRGLERDGLVALGSWAKLHGEEIEQAQSRFDALKRL
jgi:DNA-binding HxlR family transcriptional regulator